MKINELGIPADQQGNMTAPGGAQAQRSTAQQSPNNTMGQPMGAPDVDLRSPEAMKAKAEQKKQIQAQIKATQEQLRALQQQLQSIK